MKPNESSHLLGRRKFVLALCWTLILGWASAEAADVTIFRNVAVFDGQRMLETNDVLVSDGLIRKIGPGIDSVPAAKQVNGAGFTLLPGLIDCHTHTFARSMLRQALAFGVTTELDMFCDHEFAATMRDEQRRGQANDRADLYSAGTLVTVAGGHGTQFGLAIPTIESPDDAQSFVDARIAEGSDYIKLVYDDFSELGRTIPTMSKEILSAAIGAAHRRDKLAVVHVLSRQAARDAISSGADGLVHLFIDEAADESFVDLAVKQRVFAVPTLSVLLSCCGTPRGSELTTDAELAPYLTPDDVQSLKSSFPHGAGAKTDYSAARRTVAALRAAGVPILAGTDAPNPGTTHGASLHGELELLVEAGLSAQDALAAATSVAASKFKLVDRGRIAPGLVADLLLVRGDPTSEIRATRRIVGVWKRGQEMNRGHFRGDIEAKRQEIAKLRNQPPPSGSENGLVSDFESEAPTSTFGSGWAVSTDSFVGGKSKADFKVAPGGANGSMSSLIITGTIDDKPSPRWGGAIFYPGTAPMTPVNLSSKKELSFWARGDGHTYSVMVFARSKGFVPIAKTFVASAEWKQYRFKLADFEGFDGSDIMGLFFGGATDVGDFEFRLDDVRFE